MNRDTVLIYCDGSCFPNPGIGGYAALIRYGITGPVREVCGGDKGPVSNNQMELKAAIMALRTLDSRTDVIVYSDSKYVVDGASMWLKGWIKKGWRIKGGDKVKNQELWQEIDELNRRHNISWRWVKGHNGHPENEYVDRLARTARPV